MKIKTLLITLATIISIAVLSFICMQITGMVHYGDTEMWTVSSELQRIITSVIFMLMIVSAIIVSFLKKIQGVNLGISIFYSIPLIGYSILGFRSFNAWVEMSYYPFREIDFQMNHLGSAKRWFGLAYIIVLTLVPLTLFFINVYRGHRSK